MNLSVPCLLSGHRRCVGVTNPEYIGGIAKCECECHESEATA